MKPTSFSTADLSEFIKEHSHLDIRIDVEMKKYTTFGIGGPADVLVLPTTEAELHSVLKTCERLSLPLFFLGGGSNLLVADEGVRGVVIKLAGSMAKMEVFDDGESISVGAGVSFPALTKKALELGWESALGWMGTPGLVGGALKMNAGTRDGCIGEVVVEVNGVSAGKQFAFAHDECGFAYRSSDFPSTCLLTRAHLQCDDRRSESPGALKLRAKELLKKRHQSQPKKRSAGSIFKNPPGDFAGRLIEVAGLKGMKKGGAQISDVHANFIVNLGDATAADVLHLAGMCQEKIASRFHVNLEWEVRRVGDFK
ncbi:MAG: UDP-N-acetylmuramate dehydrogenase [Deltaproteobacteria bacterium]|nr:UDP-N-acetylmuramate dehydrogenase [Deltaproteobacteria bacterium]